MNKYRILDRVKLKKCIMDSKDLPITVPFHSGVFPIKRYFDEIRKLKGFVDAENQEHA